jgi:homoserine kinase
MAAAARSAGAVGACLSGAGPAVLALAGPQQVSEVCAAMDRAGRDAGVVGSSLEIPISPIGAHVITD